MKRTQFSVKKINNGVIVKSRNGDNYAASFNAGTGSSEVSDISDEICDRVQAALLDADEVNVEVIVKVTPKR